MTFPVPGGSTFLRAIRNLADVASKSAAYNNLSPMTAKGDMEYDSANGVAARLPIGAAGTTLQSVGGIPSWQPARVLQASTGLPGFALQNATPTIVTWTPPDDGQLHRFDLFITMLVTSSTTGGDLSIVFWDCASFAQRTVVILGGTQGTGVHGTTQQGYESIPVPPGKAVSLVQTSAMTGGAASAWAEIWGS